MSHDRAGADAGGLIPFLVMTFAFSWAVWTPAVLAGTGVIDVGIPVDALTALSLFVGAFGPLAAALALSRRAGAENARALLRRGLQWRTIGARAWVAIVVLPFAANGLARLLDTATGGTPPPFSAGSVVSLIPVFFAILLLGGPVQEEFGWRGYALPRLLHRLGVVGATVALGVVWTVWHLPFWFMEGSGMAGTPFPVYLVYMLGLTAVMSWLHLDSRGSVLAAILMHTTANWISNVLPTHSAEAAASNAYLYQALVYAVVGAALVAGMVRSARASASDAARRPERAPA